MSDPQQSAEDDAALARIAGQLLVSAADSGDARIRELADAAVEAVKSKPGAVEGLLMLHAQKEADVTQSPYAFPQPVQRNR